jgi:hypothetical protein
MTNMRVIVSIAALLAQFMFLNRSSTGSYAGDWNDTRFGKNKCCAAQQFHGNPVVVVLWGIFRLFGKAPSWPNLVWGPVPAPRIVNFLGDIQHEERSRV